ncbi:hypothetical protein LINPERHAP1_LOCUS22367, partial [Linum perenne]
NLQYNLSFSANHLFYVHLINVLTNLTQPLTTKNKNGHVFNRVKSEQIQVELL